MFQYIIRRLAITILLIFIIATITFSILHLMPGDPVQILLATGETSSNINPEAVQALRRSLGLDKPILVQYFVWWKNLLMLDLGNSLYDKTPVVENIFNRLPRTLELIISAVVIGVCIGLPIGIIGAINRNRWPDQLVSIFAGLGISSPVYVVGTLLVLIFGLYIPWFPASGYKLFSESPWQHIRQLTLPAITIGINQSALVARMTRSSMLEVMSKDYIRTARAKGLGERLVIYRHALKNAMIPIVTVIGLSGGSLLGGTVLVEFVFNWPGLSTLLMEGIYHRDYPIVQGVLLVTSALFILLNLAVDLTYGLLDPSIRFE